MNWAARLFRGTVGVAAVSALFLAFAAAGVTRAASTGAVVPLTPNPGKFNALTGVAALSPSNAWAVGTYCVANCSFTSAQTSRSMIVHWNGKAWSRVASPNPGVEDLLHGVAAISATNVWAAGWYSSATTGGPLLLHWNGRNWSQVTTNFTDFANVSSISATSAKDIWAAGYGFAANGLRNEIIHWDGSSWSKVPTPNPGKSLDLVFSVSADSARDAWAVGQYCASGCASSSAVNRAFALHWNGVKWSLTPLSVSNSVSLVAVDAVSATDAWASGEVSLSRNRGGPLLLHWNGRKWSKVTVATGFPQALAFSSASSGWGVGPGSFLRWNGRGWSYVPVRAPLSSDFFGVSTDRPSDAWAVGNYCVAKCNGLTPVQDTITMHWNGKTWTRK
jgi:hypothetical protein